MSGRGRRLFLRREQKWTSRWRVLLVLLIGGGAVAHAQSLSGDDDRADNQLWPDVSASIKLPPGAFNLALFGTIRIGRNDTAPISRQAGFGLNRAVGKYLTTGMFYRYVASEPAPTHASTEHRIWPEATLRIPIGGRLTLVDRTRIEFRRLESNGGGYRNSWRPRNRLLLERPLHIGDHQITPFIAGEGFYDSRFHDFTRFLYLAGARIPFANHVSVDAQYMRVVDTRARPGFLHVVWVTTRLEF